MSTDIKASNDELEDNPVAITASSRLLHQAASDAAKAHARQWFQKTLREVFQQGFKARLLEIISDSQVESSKIRVSQQDLEDCLDLVLRFKDSWKAHMQDPHGHFQASEWLEDVFETGRQSLWSGDVQQQAPTPSQKSLPKRRRANASSGNKSDLSSTGATLTSTPSSNGATFLPYSVLRNLPEIRPNSIGESQELDPHQAVKKIQQMGLQDSPPASYWPASMIQPLQEAAEDLPQRLRPERRPSLLSQLQVLPKSVWRTQRQEFSTTTTETAENRALRDGSQNQVAPSGFSDNILYELVRPKKPRKNPSRKRPLHVTDLALRQEEEPRQASDISSAKYHVASELTDAEKKGLDELIHAEEDSVTPTATIFGPLTQVGRLHAQARRQQDPPPKDQTDKQRRRKDRAYIKERLLPNTWNEIRILKHTDLKFFIRRVSQQIPPLHRPSIWS